MSDSIFIKKGLTLVHRKMSSPIATWEWNASSNTLLCSDKFYDILNLPKDTEYLSSVEQAEYFFSDGLKKLAKKIQTATNEGIPFETKLKVLKGKKETIHCLVFGYPRLDAENKVISISGTVKDISKSEEASIFEEVLNYQKEIFDFSSESILILKSDDNSIIEVNKTCEQLTGYASSELQGKKLVDLCSHQTVSTFNKVESYLKKAIADDDPQVFDCLITASNGQEIWLEVLAKYVKINHQERLVLSARNISQRKKDEQSQKINELKQKFLINISLFKAKSMESLLEYVISEVLKNTKSIFGYLHYFDDDAGNILVLKNLKDRFEELDTIEKETFFKLEDKKLWADLVSLRKPIIDNHFKLEYLTHKVFEQEEASELKFMSIPVFKNDKIVATLAVMNSKRDYRNIDIEQLISFMDAIWEVIDLKDFSEKSREDDSIYMSAISQAPYIIEQYDENGLQVSANREYEKLWGFPASTTVNSFNILKSIEIRNSGLYEYVLKAYQGESVLVPDYQYNAAYNTSIPRWFNTRIFPVTDEEGFVKGITVMHEDITDRKLSAIKDNEEKEQLKVRSDLISEIIDQIPASVFWKDANGIYRGCNSKFSKDAGFDSPDEIIGKTDDGLEWNRELRKVRSLDIELLNNKTVENKEYRIRDQKGDTLWINQSLFPLNQNKSGFDGVLGIYEDITALKNLETTLHQKIEKASQQRFSLAKLINYDNLEDIYKYVSDSLKEELSETVVAFTSTNQSETKLTVKCIRGVDKAREEEIRGITKYNIFGKNINIFPTNYEIYKRGKLVEFKGGLDLYFGLQFPASDARKIENLLDIGHIYTMGINQDDKLLGVVHFFSQKALSAEEKTMAESIVRQAAFVIERRVLDFKEITNLDSIYKTIENASDAMVVLEAQNGIIAASNKKSEALFNRTTEDLVGFHYATLFPSDLRDDINKAVNEAVKNSTPMGGEYLIEQAKNGHIPVIISSSVIPNNNKTYILLVLQNISKRKQAETQIEQQNKELQQLISTKDKLFSIISHDLKNPLTGIVGFAEVVKEEMEDEADSELSKFMDIIIRSADSMVYLINNLLHWSRLQQGKIEARFGKVKIYETTEREFELLFATASNKNIELINDIDPNLLVYSDNEMLSTVIRNLVSNAIKFTPNDGSIRVTAFTKGNKAEVSITDTGVGMSDDMAEGLFKINTDVQRSGTAGESGTGLGLVICHDFVKQNNGEIWVDSTLDVGTTIHFTVPVFNA